MRRNEIHPPTDFVITWVDGSDKVWQRMRGKYASSMTNDDRRKNSKARYRDMELLRFWFRGVEQFAPWVNRIHFVTCGQVPPWLNTKHPKLHVVNHTDYIPPKNLPTFNSNAIELGIHQIAGLTEQFVYFNDDVFLTAPIEEMTFFRNGLPCDMYEVKALVSFADGDDIDYTRLNNLGVINRHFLAVEVNFARHERNTIFTTRQK